MTTKVRTKSDADYKYDYFVVLVTIKANAFSHSIQVHTVNCYSKTCGENNFARNLR